MTRTAAIIICCGFAAASSLVIGRSAQGADAAAAKPLAVIRDTCLRCHSTAKQEGEFDLERLCQDGRLGTAADAAAWEQVLEQISLGEMPPKDAPQPSAADRAAVIGWIRSTLDAIARSQAGDPGPVVLRRLSNHEYTYSIRDLTGIESLDPAREFPVDGAAGEGFANTGAALVMSPALLTKYLDAAKDVAAHAVFTPHGMRWSESSSPQDWTNETLAEIRALYHRHTTAGTAAQTIGQGIRLDTGTGDGRLPLARYLDALQGRGPAEGLSGKYLELLRAALTSTKPSLLLDPLRARFREKKLTVADIEPWQKVLWRFANVGHIGKENGPLAWQERVTPLMAKHEIRLKLPADRDVTLYLSTSDAGDGTAQDDVVWENPRLVIPGRPDLPTGDLPAVVKLLEAERAKIIAGTEQCLAAIAAGTEDADRAQLAVWRQYLGLGGTALEPLLTKKVLSVPDYDFIKGWSGADALSVLANSSDAQVRIPGTMKPHSVATHPAPKQAAVLAWRCEKPGTLRIRGDVVDAHPECGNGVTWAVEVRRGHATETLGKGETKGATMVTFGPFEGVKVEAGQVVSLVIGPKDGNHACDLTTVNLTLEDGSRSWDLAKDVSGDILKGNPHGPWHFLSQPSNVEAVADVPAPLAAWRKNPSPELAAGVRRFLEQDFPLTSPLLRPFLQALPASSQPTALKATAPSVLELRIPAALAVGAEFVVTGRLADQGEGSVQMQVLTQKPESTARLVAGTSVSADKGGQWSDNRLVTQHSAPIIVNEGSESRRRFQEAFAEFRDLFPINVCYPRIVPVDEVVTLTLFYREDDHLRRLLLTDAESRELDRLWDELFFVSGAPLKQVDAFEQLWQFATQDAKPSAFEPMRQPIMQAAARFKEQQKTAVEPQKAAVLAFAERAWRRPLTEHERSSLRAFDPRLMLVRVLTSPAFLYRGEKPGAKTGPVNDWELATRLSYFLWSSVPDDELRSLAAAGSLRNPDVLAAQARRMLADAKVRRLATEFGCQYLHVRDVATLDEKSERHFPTFGSLRESMQEEVTRFFVDLFQHDRSVVSLLDADHSFLNKPLADHYGIPFTGEDWQRVDGVRGHGRGGVLGFAATLAKHSGASRTSAILRGTWLSEVVLGEKIPNPPKGVPVLPEEPQEGLSERQLIERHSSDPRCAGCHRRIDPYGFALEGFDAIGRGRTADTKTVLHDGTAIEGTAGLRDYLVNHRRQDFLRQFSRKLLGYALGRSVQLSDQPLVTELAAVPESRADEIVVRIVRSPQFREIRGTEP
jgi:hypothetical protein